jgi:septum site-determining protein MinC
MSTAANAFDIKSASLDLLALHLKTAEARPLLEALESRFGRSSAQNGTEAFLLDLEALPQPAGLDLGMLLPAFSARGIRIVALRHPDPKIADLAYRFGLAYVASTPAGKPAQDARTTVPAAEDAKPEATTAATPEPTPAPAVAAESAANTAIPNTVIVDKPVRAGQQVYARGGDLIVLAMVSAGAEVIADGNIHVYAPLRGRALAGARGNTDARIFTRTMEAELVSIAGVYRTIEQALPDSIKGRPAQIYLENERLVITALGE